MITMINHEWISLIRNRILLGAIAILFFAGIYSIYYGNTEIAKQITTIAQLKKAEKESVEKQKEKFTEPNFDISWRINRTVVNEPNPLAALTIGQRDVFPYYKKVGAYGLYGSIFSSEIANPFKLLTGNFDLSFVFIFLLPLLIIALGYNILSSEQEQGTLSLLLVNTISLRQILLQKLFFRLLLVLTFVLLLFCIGIIWTATSLNVTSISWLFSVFIYVLFWFSVIFCCVSYQKNSSVNAILLLGSWLVFVIVIPVFLNLYLESTRPLGSGANLQRELRENTERGWNIPRKLAFDLYFKDAPYHKVDTTKVNADMVFEIAAIHLMDKKATALFKTYKNQLSDRVYLAHSISWLSPATQIQTTMNQLANVDTDAYIHYLENLQSYFCELKDFFDSKKLANKKFEKADFDSVPSPKNNKIMEPNIGQGFISVAILIIIFLGVGWRKY